ncbi:hypothetical protein [Desulfosporosinus sp. FKA]|uniref:hypothetical protein n=1 Tax=Desulfosporosinus sp. FKA TaxID=1969834 RepID=UPI000B4A4151|nr:hypothetical protein [Desulfosporosinus sp. FKA]
MVLLRFLSNDNGKIRYEYQPECKGDFGILFYDATTGEGKVEKPASDDPTGFDGKRAMLSLVDFAENNNFPKEYLRATH